MRIGRGEESEGGRRDQIRDGVGYNNAFEGGGGGRYNPSYLSWSKRAHITTRHDPVPLSPLNPQA